MLSGGKDSVTTTHVLDARGELEGCVAIDTGTATPDWRPFIEDLCAKQGWKLEIVRTPVEYDAWVLKYGFPGAGMHNQVMFALKGRAMRLFKKAHPGAVLASGVRSAESARRALNTKAVGSFEGMRIVAPIHDWTTPQVWEYVRKHNLPRSPAYATLHMSGDCTCGAMAHRDEFPLLRTFYPGLAERYMQLTARLRALGRKKNLLWGGNASADPTQAVLGATFGQRALCGACIDASGASL